MPFEAEDAWKLVAAMVAGGLIGAEREFRDKAAGFRTLIFICLGAALFTMFSIKLGGEDDPARIAANVVTGIGFLGAGAILREGLRVRGLTTAAAIWLSAALGMGIAAGHFGLVGLALFLSLVVLWCFPVVEHHIDRLQETRTYRVTSSPGIQKLEEIERIFAEAGVRLRGHRQVRQGKHLVCHWTGEGRASAHEKVLRALLENPEVEELESY
jgi:putative Mg2+ transporter-C (MgtC) family protein